MTGDHHHGGESDRDGIDAQRTDGSTTLPSAASTDHFIVDIHAKDKWERTALHSAAEHGHSDRVRDLLERGADVHAKDKYGETALHLAALNGHSEAVQLLLTHGAAIHAKGNSGETALNCATSNGKTDTVRLLLEHGADIHEKDKDGRTALNKAAVAGHTDIVCLLLGRGARIDATDKRGRAPLLSAAFNGHSDTVRLLLEHRADIHIMDKSGETALSWAASKGKIGSVRLLLEYGASVHEEDKLGCVALHMAAYTGQLETVRLLLDQGANIHAKNHLRRTALHLAADYGQAETVRLLLSRGADIDVRDKYAETALHNAIAAKHVDTVRLLLESGADVHASNDHHRTALHLAANYGQAEIVRLLLDRGADIHAKDEDGQSALSLAIQSTSLSSTVQTRYDTARTLCESGASWDESCHRDDPGASETDLSEAAGVRASVRHWTRELERDQSVVLTPVPIENVEQGSESVDTYLSAIATTAVEEIVRRRKLCVIGPSCSGKTSFIKSLQELKTVMVDEVDRTIGVDLFALNWKATPAATSASVSGKFEATIWDFAGQDVYQVAHSLYFSKRTLYLVFVNVEAYNDQLRVADEDDVKQIESRLSRWVRDSIFCWVQLVLGRQPDAELVFVFSKCDRVDDATVDTIASDLDHRLAAWLTDFANEHSGAAQAQIQKSVQEFTERERLRVSVATQDTVAIALEDVQRVVAMQPERAYLMPRLFSLVLKAMYDIREAAAATNSIADRVEQLLMQSDKLVEALMDKIDGLQRRQCRDILGTLHALGDILWFDQERHLSAAGSSTVVVDPKLLLDLVREIVNHELEDRDGEAYDVLRTHGELQHSLLATFPLWSVLCEERPELVLYFKRLLQHFNLAYPVGTQAMAWDSDLIVPSYWKTKKQPAHVEDGGEAEEDSLSNEARWQYTVPANVSETIFDQFIVQSHGVGYERSVASTGVVMTKHGDGRRCTASIVYNEGRKPSEDVILICVNAESLDECWRTMELLVVAMERVLDGYPGLGSVHRHVLKKKKGDKYAAYDVQRLIKGEDVRDAAAMVAKIKTLFCPPSVGA